MHIESLAEARPRLVVRDSRTDERRSRPAAWLALLSEVDDGEGGSVGLRLLAHVGADLASWYALNRDGQLLRVRPDGPPLPLGRQGRSPLHIVRCTPLHCTACPPLRCRAAQVAVQQVLEQQCIAELAEAKQGCSPQHGPTPTTSANSRGREHILLSISLLGGAAERRTWCAFAVVVARSAVQSGCSAVWLLGRVVQGQWRNAV